MEESKIAILGDRLGVNGFFVQDLDNNGSVEIILTGNSAANATLSESHFVNILEVTDKPPFYTIRYQTDYFDALSDLFVADLDGDKKYEIFIGRKDGIVQVFAYSQNTLSETHKLNLESEVIKMTKGDGDNDGVEELLVGTKSGVYLIDENFNQKSKLAISVFRSIQVGNVDLDEHLEIVTNSGVFEVHENELTNQWEQPPFGIAKILLQDLDNDGISEVVTIFNTTISTYDAHNRALLKELKVNNTDVAGFHDINGDGIEEIFYYGIEAYDLSKDSIVFSIKNSASRLVGFEFFDLNNDGKKELVTAGGYGSTGGDFIYVYDLTTQRQLWKTDFINPGAVSPFGVYTVGNVDQDSLEEIVAFHHSSYLIDTVSMFESRLNNIYIYNAETKEVEWTISHGDTSIFGKLFHIRDLIVSDLTGDGVNEILVAASYRNQPSVTIINSQTKDVVATYIYPRCGIARQVAVADVDNDNQNEIIISTDALCSDGTTKILVINSTTYELEWESEEYNGGGHSEFSNLYVADIDNDDDLEILALNDRIYIFDVDESTFWISPEQGIKSLAVSNIDSDSNLELVYDHGGSSKSFNLNVLDGKTKMIENTISIPIARRNIKGLLVKDLNGNGIYEFYFSIDKRIYMFEEDKLLYSRTLGNQLNIFDNLISTDYGNTNSGQVLLIGTDHALYELGSTCYECLNFDLAIKGTNPSCDPTKLDGSLVSSFEGGSLPLSYRWNNGSSHMNRDSLDAGVYTLVTEDSKGCRASDSLRLTRPLMITNPIVLSGYCENVLGSAEIQILAGTAPFEYQWSNNDYSSTADSLLAGPYTVTTTDSNGCKTVDTIEIPTIDLGVRISQLYSACNDQNTGQSYVKVASGRKPYSYLWSNGDTSLISKNLSAGPISVQVTDSSGCSMSDSSFVERDSLLFESIIDTICVENSVKGKIKYQLHYGELPVYVAYNIISDSLEFSHLNPGRYIIPIANYNCWIEDTLDLSFNPLGLSILEHHIDDSLFSIEVHPFGGKSPYRLTHNGVEFNSNTLELPPGVHKIIVQDVNGCTYMDSVTLGVSTPSIDLSPKTNFNLSPNPFNDRVQVTCSDVDKILIYNSYGHKIREVLTNGDHGNLTLEFTNEPSGVYYFYAINKYSIESQKVIFQGN